MGVVSANAQRIMRENCIKQSLLAEKAGFSIKEFSALMTGRKLMREEHITAIANALGVTPNELFARKQDTA